MWLRSCLTESQWWNLNPRPFPYQGNALPLSYIGRKNLSERPGSNRRPSAWKADALPTELLSLKFCGESRIRTCEVKNSRFTVCPRWPLEYLPKKSMSRWRDSNPRPADYKSAALASWATSAFFKNFKKKDLFYKKVCKCIKEYLLYTEKMFFFAI